MIRLPLSVKQILTSFGKQRQRHIQNNTDLTLGKGLKDIQKDQMAITSLKD